MAWRVRRKLHKAPPGVELIAEKLEEFELRMREALNAPMDDKRRNELSWPMHKITYEKNRYLYDMHYKHNAISKKLLDFLAKEKLCDGKLMAKWRKPGYERLCSLLAITKSNTNFRTVSVCRTPLRDRTGQIMPNVMTGCVSCASGDGGPIWWDDPVPDIVKRRIAAIDPGKQEILDRAAKLRDSGPQLRDDETPNGEADVDADEELIIDRAKKLREGMVQVQSEQSPAAPSDEREQHDKELIVESSKRPHEAISNSENSPTSAPTSAGQQYPDDHDDSPNAKRRREDPQPGVS